MEEATFFVPTYTLVRGDYPGDVLIYDAHGKVFEGKFSEAATIMRVAFEKMLQDVAEWTDHG